MGLQDILGLWEHLGWPRWALQKNHYFSLREFTYFFQASCLLIYYLFSAKIATKFPKRPVYLWSPTPGESEVQKA